MLQRRAITLSVPEAGGGASGSAPSSPSSKKRKMMSRRRQQSTAAAPKRNRRRRRRAQSDNAASGEASHSSQRYPRWHSVAAGAAAGAGSRFLIAPLDLLRIRRQLQTYPPPPGSVSDAAFKDAISSTARKPLQAHTAAKRVVSGRFGMFSSLAKIARDEGGVRSLFRGNLAATYLWVSYAAIQFSLYARTSEFVSSFAVSAAADGATAPSLVVPPPRRPPRPLGLPAPIRSVLEDIASSPTAVAFTSGATAGLCATMATYPFDLCRTTFAARGLSSGGAGAAAAKAAGTAAGTAASASLPSSLGSPPQSIAGFARTMYRARGVRGFYAGAVPAAVQIVPYMGLNFALYDYFVRVSDVHFSVGNAGLAGTVAGGVSKFLVYPVDTIKKRLQAQAFVGLGSHPNPNAVASASASVTYKGMIDCASTMMREEGLAAFYRGLVPTVLKSCAATGFTFAFYALAKNALEATHDRLAAAEEREEDEDDGGR